MNRNSPVADLVDTQSLSTNPDSDQTESTNDMMDRLSNGVLDEPYYDSTPEAGGANSPPISCIDDLIDDCDLSATGLFCIILRSNFIFIFGSI